MLSFGGSRVVLLSTAALAAGVTGVALHDRGGDTASALPVDFPALQGGHWRWSFSTARGDAVEVHSRRCPKGHPLRVGSFSYSSTRAADGKVEHHSARGSICAK